MIEAGRIVRSVAGHDKDRFYVAVKAEGGKVWIADGERRKLEKPKAKNERHLRLTAVIADAESWETNKRLRKLLGSYNGAAMAEEGGSSLCPKQM
jgi:ribosomal protein L14E/L6E/L27E